MLETLENVSEPLYIYTYVLGFSVQKHLVLRRETSYNLITGVFVALCTIWNAPGKVNGETKRMARWKICFTFHYHRQSRNNNMC
ncbi:hypothetical protein M378DRAFT_551242 [Amanita muscaria Koide BX008]|uniref:Uncharacterized protein n=1 Tax=Amanita muscaria (strain Koide BX008) TaxID=946122 RepID=A0A0C2W4A3_AMAMK|nr:hypothetical protein M378DRAFT_551242 [Amanita muscaria Koide BX008]